MEEKPSQLISNLKLEKGDRYLDLERINQKTKPQIFVIPSYIREKNPSAYEPRRVSIGPIHYGKPHLMSMQIHKKRALFHFLERSGVPVESYQDKLKAVLAQVRESYEQVDWMDSWKGDDDFTALVILDGVFLLEFMSVAWGAQECYDYSDIDPIFGRQAHRSIYESVMQDLLLVENQLPYLVLYTLLSVSKPGVKDEIICGTLSCLMRSPRNEPGLHLLDMYMKGLMEEPAWQSDNMVGKHSASELRKCGIQFKKAQSYNKVKFDKKTATLKLPSIIIDQYTLSTFLNLKVYELRKGKNKDLNSYIHLIYTLVQTTKDVMLLQSKGIIVNSLGSNEAALETIKGLMEYSLVDQTSIPTSVLKEMDKYYQENRKNALQRLCQNLVLIFSSATTLHSYPQHDASVIKSKRFR